MLSAALGGWQGTRALFRPQRNCKLCQLGKRGDEFYPVYERQALQRMRDAKAELDRGYAGTRVQLSWQAGLHGSVVECLKVYTNADLPRSRHLTAPRGWGRKTPLSGSHQQCD